MPLNSEGASVQFGSQDGEYGGDTGLRSNDLYYCGREMGQCRCGQCDGQCGPHRGCPCNSCIGLQGFKINRDNVLCKRGACASFGSGGDTGMKSVDLFYCGRIQNQCRCGDCRNGGRCGPNFGCPCSACLPLVGLGGNTCNNFSSSLTWLCPSDPKFCLQNAVQAGWEDDYKLFVARSHRDGEIVPGKYFPEGSRAYFVHSGGHSGEIGEHEREIQVNQFEVLMDPQKKCRWTTGIQLNGKLPPNAVVAGYTVGGGGGISGDSGEGEKLFIGRCKQNGHDACGKIVASEMVLVYGYFKKIFKVDDFEVLVYSSPSSELSEL